MKLHHNLTQEASIIYGWGEGEIGGEEEGEGDRKRQREAETEREDGGEEERGGRENECNFNKPS